MMSRDEEQHYIEVLGGPDDYSPQERSYDAEKAYLELKKIKKHYVGIDKPQIQIVREKWQERDHREYGDNDPSDPEQNWDEDEVIEPMEMED